MTKKSGSLNRPLKVNYYLIYLNKAAGVYIIFIGLAASLQAQVIASMQIKEEKERIEPKNHGQHYASIPPYCQIKKEQSMF